MNIKYLLNCFSEEMTMKKWNIGFTENNLDLFFSSKKTKISYLKHDYKNKWFADPFILDVTEKEIILLVEEYDNNIKKGRIARLVVNRDNLKLISMKIVLDLKSHLSFPAIYKENSSIYICPENSQSGQYIKYTYDDKTQTLINPQLIINEPLTDAIKYFINGVPYIFSTKQPSPNGNKLFVYTYGNNKSKFKLKQEILLDDNTARGAGHFIQLNEKIIRPAQDCNNSYGAGLVFQEIKQVKENEEFKIKELKRIYSKSIRYGQGMHTFNTFGDIAVIDVLGYKYIILGRIYSCLRIFVKYFCQLLK